MKKNAPKGRKASSSGSFAKPKPAVSPPTNNKPNGQDVPEKDKGGRPSKFSPEVVETLLKHISEGLPLSLSCRLAGITYHTMRSWVKKANEPDAQEEFIKFLTDLTGALNSAEHVIARRLVDEARHGKDWRCTLAVAARMYPEDWADTGAGGGPIQVQGAVISVKGTPEEYVNALRQATTAITDGQTVDGE
jgi:transposase-like protein